ncbi:E3 binding domain-containing protein [Deinococcus oregonensis]|uniref:E3 binding domain-containing protein n=1 Tax=Deinococcus oregonensis TaxID=1805970 RepID=A0ABV6B161_9DEIO
MDRIAPLAKILAEANGIDWQRLNGTGEGGMVVEQDILNYLSRVMSGEEEPPETPVDLPPPDWEGDLANSNFDMAALSAAGVDSDITSFIEQARPAAPQVPVTPAAAFEEEAMEFEMDEGEDDGEDLLTTEPPVIAPAAQISVPLDVPEVAAAAVTPETVQPEPELEPAAVVPERIVVPEPVQPEPVQPEPVRPEPIQIPAAAAVVPPAAAASKGGLGGLLSRLYQNRAAPQDTPPAPSMVGPAFATPKVEQPATFTPAASAPEVAAPNITVPDIAAPVIPDIALPSLAAAEMTVPELTAADLSIEAEQNTPDFSAPQVDAPLVSDNVASNAVTSEPVQTWVGRDDVTPVLAAPTAAVSPVAPVSPVAAPDPVAAAMVGAVSTSGTGLSQSSEAPAALPRDAVWFGAYLRRDAQVAAAADLREQLSEALGRDVPLALLVARAAQHHAAILDLSAVAIQDPSTARTRSARLGSLRDAVTGLDTDHDGTPDLLVVDAGLLDLDDLHYPHALTLSVGRVQGGRAALTLNGNVDTERAARFLASVAQTLEKPVILVV